MIDKEKDKKPKRNYIKLMIEASWSFLRSIGLLEWHLPCAQIFFLSLLVLHTFLV